MLAFMVAVESTRSAAIVGWRKKKVMRESIEAREGKEEVDIYNGKKSGIRMCAIDLNVRRC